MSVEKLTGTIRCERSKRKDVRHRLTRIRIRDEGCQQSVLLVGGRGKLGKGEPAFRHEKGCGGDAYPTQTDALSQVEDTGCGGESLSDRRISHNPVIVDIEVLENFERRPAVRARAVNLVLKSHPGHAAVDFPALCLKAFEEGTIHGGFYERREGKDRQLRPYIGKPLGASVGLNDRLSIVRARKSHDLIVPTGRP